MKYFPNHAYDEYLIAKKVSEISIENVVSLHWKHTSYFKLTDHNHYVINTGLEALKTKQNMSQY